MLSRNLATVVALTLAACFLLTAGCLVRGKNYENIEGRYIGDQTLSRIEPGETNREWVLAVMGEPTTKSTLDTGRQIWKWEYRRVKSSSGSVLFVFGGSDRSVEVRNVYVEFEDDTVTSVWRD